MEIQRAQLGTTRLTNSGNLGEATSFDLPPNLDSLP